MKKITDEFTMKDILENPEFGVLCYLVLKTYEDTGFTPEQIKALSVINELRGKIIESAIFNKKDGENNA